MARCAAGAPFEHTHFHTAHSPASRAGHVCLHTLTPLRGWGIITGAEKMLNTFLLIVCELQWVTGISFNALFEFVSKQFESNLVLKLIRWLFEFVAVNLMYLNF